jgi:hypothetical protein
MTPQATGTRNQIQGNWFSGASRRDRTGDLPMTKFPVYDYAIESTVGQTPITLPHSAWAGAN